MVTTQIPARLPPRQTLPRRGLWTPFVVCVGVLMLALAALAVVLTWPEPAKPVGGPVYDGIERVTFNHWIAAQTAGDEDLTNHSKRPATISFVGANAKHLRVVGVYLTVDNALGVHQHMVLAVGNTAGLPTQNSVAVRGVTSWPHHLTLPATIPPGKTQWQIVWAIKTLGPVGGSMHGATLRISQGGHSWLTHSQVWALTPKKR